MKKEADEEAKRPAVEEEDEKKATEDFPSSSSSDGLGFGYCISLYGGRPRMKRIRCFMRPGS